MAAMIARKAGYNEGSDQKIVTEAPPEGPQRAIDDVRIPEGQADDDRKRKCREKESAASESATPNKPYCDSFAVPLRSQSHGNGSTSVQ
jgi:hypothetical protein